MRVGRLYKLRNETLNSVPVLESAAWLGLWIIEGRGEGVREEMARVVDGQDGVGEQVNWGVYEGGYRAGKGVFVGQMD